MFMLNILILTGNEVHHNFLCNSLILNCTDHEFTILKTSSDKTNFEFFYSKIKDVDQQSRDKVVEFIFDRNRTLCLKEPYDMLKAPKKQEIFNNSHELHLYLEKLLTKRSYDLVLTYSCPIMKNKEILRMEAFNLHFGLSRYYRGGRCNLTALAHKEFDKVGVTCHELNAEVDEGKVLFEFGGIPKEAFNSIDTINYFLLKKSVGKIINLLNKGKFETYSIPKGKLILNKSFDASMLIKAQENIKAFKGLL